MTRYRGRSGLGDFFPERRVDLETGSGISDWRLERAIALVSEMAMEGADRFGVARVYSQPDFERLMACQWVQKHEALYGDR